MLDLANHPGWQAELAALGWPAAGVAAVQPPPHLPAFDEWLRQGMHAGMDWLRRTRDLRANPAYCLPGARSILMFKIPYPFQTRIRIAAAPARGVIAAYARGEDYHETIMRGLKRLDAWLQLLGGRQWCTTDAGHLMERDFAQLSGLGWQGKSTMVLSRSEGTYFFLAAIVTTLACRPTSPVSAHCGSCTRCLEVCPTQAFPRPYVLDARRCISYLTIENKGPIPLELRPLMHDRIFGCDLCMEVCPWNRFAARFHSLRPRLTDRRFHLPLREYLRLDEARFKRLFAGTPVLRAKRRGFLRNVCVALGNVGSVDDLPDLQRAARDPESLIAEHALWAISRIHSRE